MTADTPMRRIPQQTRSQQRVDLILDTAAKLFAETGYESTTTNAIAARADVSIGSLYQYFPDKDAILRALIERYLAELCTLYDKVFTQDAAYLPLAVLLERLIDPFIQLEKNCPGFKQILLGSDVSPDIAAAATQIDQEATERIQAFFQLKAPEMPDDQAHLLAVVCKAVVKAMLSLLETAPDEAFKAQIGVEVKRMLWAYLEPILE